jgi:tRNA threonylcarbamoyladenosine biosynthesis protein TsaB
MLALAIDTSGDIAGIALATEAKLISEISFGHKMDLLRRLMPNIDRLISDAGKSQADLDGIVISLGPGSFTGLRIGMAAAKSIAHVLKRPIAGIPTLDVLACGASAVCPKSIAAAIHARPGEVFWALYRCNSGHVKRLTEDRASSVEDMIRLARQETEIVFCGDGAERNREALEAEFGRASVLDEWFHAPRAAILASLGIQRLLRGDSDDVFSLVPEYVRKPTPVVRVENHGLH